MKNKKKESELHTLSEAIAKYEKEVLYYRTRNTQKSFFLHLDFWDKNLGNQTLAKLENSALIIKNLRDSLKSKERSNTTLNRYLSALSALSLQARAGVFAGCL